MLRLVSLLRRQGKILTGLPPDWAQALPKDAPLLDAARWRQVLSTLTLDSFSDAGNHVDDETHGLEEQVPARDEAPPVPRLRIHDFAKSIHG